jgi:hydroxyacylglutathione hydrolase
MREPRQFGPVRLIPGERNGKYPHCNSVYLDGARVLIDPGSDRRALEQLRDGPGVEQVWLSHWHEDHLMHLDLFDDLPLTIHQADQEPLSDIERFIDWYGMDEPLRDPFRALLLQTFHFRPRRPARTFRGDETIDTAAGPVEVLHTPGHTPGHCALWFSGAGVLYLGDYDLTRFGPWYGDPGSSIEQTIASVRRLRAVPARVWLAAHEEGVWEGDPGEAWERYLGVIDEREGRLLAFLTEPRTMAEIVDQWLVYRKPRDPRPFFAFGERAISGKHLERLVARGAVRRDGERYVAT